MRLARLITRLADALAPLCRGGCRQPITKPCRCSWLPPLPDELRPPEE